MFRQERAVAADDVSAQECEPAAEQLARAFGFLGKRWTAIILGHLSHGPAGFRDLSRGIGGGNDSVPSGRLPHPAGCAASRALPRGIGGISDSVLSERLADLAGGGLITRTVRDGPPVTVTYQL